MQHIKFLKATLFYIFLDVFVAFHIPLFYTRLKHRVARLMMGVSFSKQKGSEEPRSEEPRSRSNSLVSLQNLNVREPGANEDQSLLQQKLISEYDSTAVIPTVVTMPIERAENYFLSNEAVLGRIFSFCSMTDLLQMRLISSWLQNIVQNNGTNDRTMLLSHAISILSAIHSFSSPADGRRQVKLILFATSPTAIMHRQVKYNPFYDFFNRITPDLSVCLKELLRNNTLSSSQKTFLIDTLARIENNIKIPVGTNLSRLFSFRGAQWVLPCVLFSLCAPMIFLIYYLVAMLEVPPMLQVVTSLNFIQLPCSAILENKVVKACLSWFWRRTVTYDLVVCNDSFSYSNFSQYMSINQLDHLVHNDTLSAIVRACQTAHFHFSTNGNNVIDVYQSMFNGYIIVFNPHLSAKDWDRRYYLQPCESFTDSRVTRQDTWIIIGTLLLSIGLLITLFMTVCYVPPCSSHGFFHSFSNRIMVGQRQLGMFAKLKDHVRFLREKISDAEPTAANV